MTDESKAHPTLAYDHRDEKNSVDPWPTWQYMREEAPYAFSEAYGGFYTIARYADLAAAARDTERFSSALKVTTIPEMPVPKMPPLHSDPPEARQWREIVNPWFSPSAVARYQPWIREIVDEVVNPLLAGDRIDLPREIGVPVTRKVILRIMGIENAPAEINAWTDAMVYEVGEAAQDGSMKMTAFIMSEIAQRRQEPRDDLISSMFDKRLSLENRLLNDEDILKVLLLVIAAALETTSSAISGMIVYLLDHPEQAERLRAEPQIWRLAMDEFVRWVSPATCLARTVRDDTELGGCPVSAGDRVMLLYGSGNHDANEFPDADDVVLDRSPNRHLGFGIGPHRCLGSHLAKAQMSIVLERFLPVLDSWRVEDKSTITWTSAVTRGMSSVPLVHRT